MVNTMKLFGRTPLLSLLVLILFGACGAYITVVLPSIVKVLVQDYGITGTQAGYIVSWEKFGMALASLALFLVIEKRKAELRVAQDRGVITRKVLERYSLPLLLRLESTVATSAFMSYSL